MTDPAPLINGAPAVWSSCVLVEFDYAGIEQVLMGWFMNNAGNYIRIAKLGTHAIVASHVLARAYRQTWAPADLTLPDADLADFLRSIKKSKDDDVALKYDQSKRTVHGTAYGLTVYGMCRNFPTIFPTVKIAEETQRVYFDVAPEVPTFHTVVRHQAHQTHYLGGAETYQYLPDQMKVVGHPYGYKHWFWSVVSYQRMNPAQILFRRKRKMPLVEFGGVTYAVTLGEDAKRAVAMYPQGTARGVLTEACFPLFDPEDALADHCYIGDLYYGRTPLRAPIHDSLFMEIPRRKLDRLIERTAYAMQRPVLALPCPADWGQGAHLTIGVDAKIGEDWGHMSGLEIPSLTDLGVANDAPLSPAEDEDEDQLLDLETRIA
jgi:hypothetical protein